jgi:aspartate carbamoyltransferase catalytic subunit
MTTTLAWSDSTDAGRNHAGHSQGWKMTKKKRRTKLDYRMFLPPSERVRVEIETAASWSNDCRMDTTNSVGSQQKGETLEIVNL